MAERKSVKEQIGVELEEPERPEPAAVVEPEPEEVTEPERPEWLPEQYKTPEDFAKAHKSAQDKIRELGERSSQYEQQLADMQAQMQAPARDPNDVFQAVADEIEAARENGDVARELQLNQWLTQQTIGQAFQGFQAQTNQPDPNQGIQADMVAAYADDSMAKRYDDWPDVRDKVAETLQTKPYLLPEAHLFDLTKLQESLDTAYQLVKTGQLLEQQQQLHEQGLSQADVNRSRKLSAQTLTGATGRADEVSEADQQLAEMKAALHGGSYAAFRNQ